MSDARATIGKVIDFGAGDGRFARFGSYESYVGYEIDSSASADTTLPPHAELVNQCAFTQGAADADVCIGNPPFVRNQDLPPGWRQQAGDELRRRTGISVSGLANAWQYFFLLALTSVKPTGLVALVIPYEWVSRPSAKGLRDYIHERGWEVSVYRLVDATFSSVLTTASITIVDMGSTSSSWRYYEELASGEYREMPSPTGGTAGVISYGHRSDTGADDPRVKRGLSPGTQRVLTLTEGERVRAGLRANKDVVPCVTTLRHIPEEIADLDTEAFNAYFRGPNRKCWLIRTDRDPSARLQAYLDSVPPSEYQTATCLNRKEWWRFTMPKCPGALVSMSFTGEFPKVVHNTAGACAVGGVSGIYGLTDQQRVSVVNGMGTTDIRQGVVAYSNGLYKVEVGQLNTLLRNHLRRSDD